MEVLISGFILGLIGSTHCIGMCGPLVFSYAFANGTRSNIFIDQILYHLGRTSSYIFLGIVVGFLGMSIFIFRAEQILSILSGIFIFFYTFFKYRSRYIQNFNFALSERIQRIIHSSMNNVPSYVSGIFNGLLPCSLVLVAFITTLNMGNFNYSILFMLSFGIGTSPLFLVSIFFKDMLSAKVRNSLSKIAPIYTYILAFVLILRGLNLDIPFLSPYADQYSLLKNIIHCHQ